MKFKHTLEDLEVLDGRYETMYQLHKGAHVGLISSISDVSDADILEVACGNGKNVPQFEKIGCRYHGLDMSETAIASCLLQYPKGNFYNMSVLDLDLFAESKFDVVYNSSMLEHIGFYKEAIEKMIRVTKKRLYILFFEGLIEDGESELKFHQWEKSYISKEEYVQSFGEKIAEQSHQLTEDRGWYWNRYSRNEMVDIVSKCGVSGIQVLDSTNTSYCDKESIMVIDI